MPDPNIITTTSRHTSQAIQQQPHRLRYRNPSHRSDAVVAAGLVIERRTMEHWYPCDMDRCVEGVAATPEGLPDFDDFDKPLYIKRFGAVSNAFAKLVNDSSISWIGSCDLSRQPQRTLKHVCSRRRVRGHSMASVRKP